MDIPKAWMPKDMLDSDKNKFVAQAPTDPHLAAALAWEAWAAVADDTPVVVSVSTGAQTASYGRGFSPHHNAMERAAWHRTRAKLTSVPVGPQYQREGAHTEGFDKVVEMPDGTRHRVIATEHATPWYEDAS